MSRLHDYIVLPVYPEMPSATYKVIRVRYDNNALSGLVYESIVANNLNREEAYKLRKKLRNEQRDN